MFGSFFPLVDRLPFGRWRWLAVLAVCLGTWGCTQMNLRGDGFADSELSDFARDVRQVDDLGQSDAFSNKARQIDMNLGGTRPGYGPVAP